jgi:DNA-binding PadR family transcriptional regulator
VSATRLLVLGVVRMYGQAHGYQVRRELLTWSADKWASVQPGSIYHALKKMAKEALLAEVGTEGGRGGRGPDRVAYAVTDDGEAEFQRMLATMLAEVTDGDRVQLAAALTFLPQLPRARAVSLLEHRLTQLESRRATVCDVLRRGTEWGQPPHVNELYRLWASQVESGIEWANDLLDRLRGGEYVMADDSPESFGSPPRTR